LVVSERARARALAIGACAATLVTFACLFRPYFPNAAGEVGGEYAYYLPHIYDGALWLHVNGPFSVPWFTPSFCGGIPAYPNPQNDYYSVPQVLDFVVGPTAAIELTALVFAGLGFVGFHLLVRDVFRAGTAAGVFAGSLFALNGFHLWRLVAGRLQFHPFMLLPLVAWATLIPTPKTNRGTLLARDTCVAGASIGYAVEAGALQHVPLIVLGVLAIGLAHATVAGARVREVGDFLARLTTAVALGLVIAAGKLAAILSFFAHTPREVYSIPGVRTAGDLVDLVFIPLWSRPRMDHLNGAIVNTPWTWNASEFELGVGPVPLLMIALGAVVGLIVLALRIARGRLAGEGARIVRTVAWGALLATLLAVPLYLNVYDPAFSALVKDVPLLRGMHAFFRYDALFIPVVVLASALVVDRLIDRRAQWLAAIAAVALLAVTDQKTDKDYGGGYSPEPIVLAHENLARRSSVAIVPPIEEIAPVELNADRALPLGQIAAGVSTFPCYEPMFGYLLETFPKTDLHRGPVTDRTGHAYNLLDPSCFVFPSENRCAPGDRIDLEEKERFERFRAHEAVPFARPWWQRLADATSVATLLIVLAVLLAWAFAA
jgi:hypothetical protein